MRLWRISNYADLSGEGGFRNNGRWHSKGRPIVYTAEHPAGALSEFLVHMDIEDIPVTFQLVTIEVEAGIEAATLAPDRLPEGWIANPAISRAEGDRWLTANSGLLLRVPSAIVPEAWNVLINPLHMDAARMRIVNTARVPLDRRLARG